MAKRSDISITVEEVPGGCSNNLFGSGDCNENVMSGDDIASSWTCGNCTGDPPGKLKIKLKFFCFHFFSFFGWLIWSQLSIFDASKKEKFTRRKQVQSAKDAYLSLQKIPVFF